MMKIILVLLLIPVFSFSQNGSVTKDTLRLNDGSYYVKGTSIDIGPGSKSDGGYAFITLKSKLNQTPLTAGWAGYKMQIIDFWENGNATMGKKYYLVLAINKSKAGKYLCDPVLAKEKGEIK
jgi:hypothetical protein